MRQYLYLAILSLFITNQANSSFPESILSEAEEWYGDSRPMEITAANGLPCVVMKDDDKIQMTAIIQAYRQLESEDRYEQQGSVLRNIAVCPFFPLRALGYIEFCQCTGRLDQFEIAYFYACSNGNVHNDLFTAFRQKLHLLSTVRLEAVSTEDAPLVDNWSTQFSTDISDDLTALPGVVARVQRFRAENPNARRYPLEMDILKRKAGQPAGPSALQIAKAGHTLFKLGLAGYLTYECIRIIIGRWF